MTKKDYELFANELNKLAKENNNENDEQIYSLEFLVNFCSNIFGFDNPSFQPDKFERACYEGKHIRKSISGRV